jgi:arylsulfatase A-like enzyme
MNVIVLVSDTFRYDYLGCNGNKWIGTAGLDRFALG